MSPRNPPLPLQQVPGTPTQSHAIPPTILHPPHPSAPQPPPSVTSPPSTPATANRSTSLSANAGAFVPAKKVSIKNPSGQEVTLDTLKRAPPTPVPPVPSSPAAANKKDFKRPIRIESQEQKEKRLAEERAKEEESEGKGKSNDSLPEADEAAARREIEEQQRRKEERKAKEEADRAEKERKEAEERAALEEKKRREAEERAAREEQERREAEELAAREAREKEEREKERVRLEEEARSQREAEKAEKERAEKERLRKLQEEEEARAKEAERQRKEEEERLEALEASENANALPSDAEPTSSLPEEGEIEEEVSQPPTAATEEFASADKGSGASRPPSSLSPAPRIPAELPVKSSEKELLRIDTTLPPSPEHPRKRPGPLNLQTTINTDIAPPLHSALATARHIEDINCITYPQGIKSPKLELNVNTQKGKFRYAFEIYVIAHLVLNTFPSSYDRDFLLQFMNICKEKPDHLPPLDVIGLEPSDTSHTMSRGGSGRNRSSNSLSMPSNTRSPSIGLGFLPGSMGKASGSGFQMGQFSTSASKMSSEERFLAASAGRSVSVTGGPLGSRPPAMVRTISQSGTGRDRTRSKRGANDSSRTSVASNVGPTAHISSMGPPMEVVAPLEMSANRWVAGSTRRNGSGVDSDSPDTVERKVKGLLNKLTMERFDSISDQIIAWANKSEREKDGRTLIQVIKLVFEKATDEATFSEMYARLCRKMMEQISPKVQDDGIKNAEGKPFAGGQLFRKYLLNRCQEDFERGWVAKETTAAAAASKATEDRAVKEANEKTKGEEESELYSDEYYAAAKAKRRGLGLIRFIGELFKLQMLTERIMHECIKKLLGNVENPEEEEIESSCKLLTTVGSLLDTQKARAHLDVYFSRMRELTKNKNVNSRMMYMLQVSDATVPHVPD
jgi:translation initiation factor 4G